MPKLKTHKGVKRRIKISATGKLRHFKTGRRHLLNHKPSKRMAHLRKSATLSPVHRDMIRRLLPNS